MYSTVRPTREQYWRQVRSADAWLDRVASTGDPTLARTPDGFEDVTAALTHVAARWSRDLAGSLDPVLDLPDAERSRAAAHVAAEVAARRPALHAVLRHHADHPAVRAARTSDRARAGLRDETPVHAEHVRPRGAGVVATVLAHCPVRRALHRSRSAHATGQPVAAA